jgi:hypothetical protein
MRLAPLSLLRATEAQRHGAVSGAFLGNTKPTKNALCASAALWLFIGVFVAPLVTATLAHAQAQGPQPSNSAGGVEFIPAATLFAVFDDNIFAGTNSTAGQMLTLRPSFEASYETPITRLLGLYAFDMQQSNFSSLTTLDARRHALGEAPVSWESAGTPSVSRSCRALRGGSVRERRCRAATTGFRNTSWTVSAEPCKSGALA